MPHLLYDSLSFIQKTRPKYKVDVEDLLRRKYPDFADVIIETTNEILHAIKGLDLDSLADHSPSLKGTDWGSYIRLSGIRVAKVLEKLSRWAGRGARVLDYGSYFGNFSISLKKMGYDVHALDSYASYGSVFDFVHELLAINHVPVHAFREPDHGLPSFKEDFDVCLCLGVIEHVPHTPRLLMESLAQIVKRDSILILETPNLAYIYQANAIASGNSIFTDIKVQYDTKIPFQGHHREYTYSEVEWILEHEGYDIVESDFYLYSIYGMPELSGEHKDLYIRMLDDKFKRELLLFVAKKK